MYVNPFWFGFSIGAVVMLTGIVIIAYLSNGRK